MPGGCIGFIQLMAWISASDSVFLRKAVLSVASSIALTLFSILAIAGSSGLTFGFSAGTLLPVFSASSPFVGALSSFLAASVLVLSASFFYGVVFLSPESSAGFFSRAGDGFIAVSFLSDAASFLAASVGFFSGSFFAPSAGALAGPVPALSSQLRLVS